MSLTRKETNACNALYKREEAKATQATIEEKLLEARNAIAMAESLLLEAYIHAPAPVAQGIKVLLEAMTSDRSTIASLQQLASLLPEPQPKEN